MDSANAVQRHLTRFTHGEINRKAGGVQHWYRAVNVTGDYFEDQKIERELVSEDES
ncbi:hypothetical protein C0J52_00980 [Blattella germanica]|nr:hypothetical protein C0J52_00980 [Blattella germanica]